jgi:uncharacterized protein YktB (UPF0637 family)
MNFPGWTAADFDLFAIPDFPGRMAEIRARLRPKLLTLAEDLKPVLTEIVGQPVFPHVAQHMRRRVNPPEETWAAWCRDKKGYKRWTHYRIAVSGSGVRTTVFVEDDADDKEAFGEALQSDARKLMRGLGKSAPILWYTFGKAPIPQKKATAETLFEGGKTLARLKLQKFQAGIEISREEALGLSPEGFEAWASEQMRVLKPLYGLGR